METKTILAQTCANYGWTLKAIEVMPEHVNLSLKPLPMMCALFDSAHTAAVHIFAASLN